MKKSTLYGILLAIAALLLLGTVFYGMTFDETKVLGPSMENTLFDGDTVLIEKAAYRNKLPQRFDVIVFPENKDSDKYLIKRIIGLPGETVCIRNSSIYINGVLLKESYGKESMDEYTEGLARTEFVLKNDEYFVLGDNRNDSLDSRDPSIGPVCLEEIYGKVTIRIRPFSKIGKIRS